MLRLDARQLKDLQITSDTARALRLRTTKVQPVQKVSPDGIQYPTTPEALRMEVWRQAKELYTCREGIPVDCDTLSKGISLWGPPVCHDTMDYITRMWSMRSRRQWVAPLQCPPSGPELQACLGHGSKVSALDELPRIILVHLGSVGLELMADMVRRTMAGEPSDLLGTAIHIPLRKKEPSWLLQNSRPVILEACSRRVASTALYRRLIAHLELHHELPSTMLAYRRQPSGL